MNRLSTTSLTTSIAAGLLIAAAAAASAQNYGYGYGGGYGDRHRPNEVDARQARQAERIERGYRDGSLTGREAAGLADQQRQIADYERRAKADGVLDPYERSNLRHIQNNAGRSIEMERRDFEGRNAAFDHRPISAPPIGAPPIGAPPIGAPWWRRWW